MRTCDRAEPNKDAARVGQAISWCTVAAVLLVWSSPCAANVILSRLELAGNIVTFAMVLALPVVLLIESILLWRRLRPPIWRTIWVVALANIVSLLVGLVLRALGFLGLYTPTEGVPEGVLAAAVFFISFLLSVLIESPIVGRLLRSEVPGVVGKSVALANAASYLVVGLLVALGVLSIN